MELSLAKDKLIEKEYFLMSCLYPNWVVKYIAITKLDITSEKLDDYILEIGYVSGQIVSGEFLIKHLIDLKRYNEKAIFFDTKNNSVCTVTKQYEVDVNTIEAVIKDFEVRNIRLVRLEEYHCYDGNLERGKFEPLIAGCSVMNKKIDDQSGTIGAFFKIKENDDIYALSNFHVFCLKKSKLDGSEFITQPSVWDANKINKSPNIIGSLYWMFKNFEIDAAVAKINVAVSNNPNFRCNKLKISGIQQPKIGMKVMKCGRTTGLTEGIIKSVCCTVNMSNKTYPKEEDIKRNQILTTCMSKNGDSGSVLVETKTKKVVGLIFAGNHSVNATYANNIMEIFNSNISSYNETKLPSLTFKEFI